MASKAKFDSALFDLIKLPIEIKPQVSASGSGGGGDSMIEFPTIPTNISTLFCSSTQTLTQDFSFNSHPVIRMFVGVLRNLEDLTCGHYRVVEALFPDRDRTLPSNAFDDIDGPDALKRMGVALTVKAFYNAMNSYDGHIQIDQANAEVAWLNNVINGSATQLLWLFYRQKFRVDPTQENVHRYVSILRSKAYKQNRLRLQASGNWSDPTLEMFNHFAELKALNASDADIQHAYNGIVGEEPKIDAGAFLQITAASWTSYRGWLPSGNLDWGDIGAHNLGSDITDLAFRSFLDQSQVDAQEWFMLVMDGSLCNWYIHNHGYRMDQSNMHTAALSSNIYLNMPYPSRPSQGHVV